MGGGPVAAARRSDVLIIYSWTYLHCEHWLIKVTKIVRNNIDFILNYLSLILPLIYR